MLCHREIDLQSLERCDSRVNFGAKLFQKYFWGWKTVSEDTLVIGGGYIPVFGDSMLLTDRGRCYTTGFYTTRFDGTGYPLC